MRNFVLVVLILCQGCVEIGGLNAGNAGKVPPVGGERVAVDTANEETPVVPLDSREFKVLLDASLFDAHPQDQAQAYLAELDASLAPSALAPVGDLELDKERTVQFLDTPSCQLRAASFVLRDRADVDSDGKRKLALKFRSGDAAQAAQQDVEASGDDAKKKLEEDVVPPFLSKYSRSTTVKIDRDLDVDVVGDATEIFPTLTELGISVDAQLEAVGDVDVFEEVYRGASFDLGGVEAEMAVTLWYLDSSDPIIAEASFSYPMDAGASPEEVTTSSVELFEAMKSMVEWRAQDSTTKTALIYDHSDCP